MSEKQEVVSQNLAGKAYNLELDSVTELNPENQEEIHQSVAAAKAGLAEANQMASIPLKSMQTVDP